MSKDKEKSEHDVSTAGKIRAPGGLGVRHLQVFLLFLGMVLGYCLRVAVSVAIVAMTSHSSEGSTAEVFIWSQPERSAILSSFFWGYTAMQLPSGYLAGVWSGQKLLAWGMFFCGFFNMLIPLAASYGGVIAVCACRVGMGLGQACILPCIHTLLSKWAPPSERARLGTFAYAGAQLGTVIAMPISGVLSASTPGWPIVFYLFGSLSMLWAIAFYFYGSESPDEHSRISEKEKQYIMNALQNEPRNDDPTKQKVKIPWKEIFTSGPMIALIIAHCGQNWGYWTLLTEMPSYMSAVLNFDIEKNGLVSGLPYLAMWLLSFPASWLSDIALKKGASRAVIRKICNTIAFWGPALALVALGLTPLDDYNIVVMILVVAVGLNCGSLCGFQINHIDLSPNFAGTMISITNFMASIVAIIAPLICGKIIESDESSNDLWNIVFYIAAGVYFFSNLFFIIFGKAEIQWWNDPEAVKAKRQERRKVSGIA